MSGNSCSRPLTTAPIVIAFAGGPPPFWSTSCACSSWTAMVVPLAGEVGELVLADLQLVAVLEAVRVDAVPVDVGAVEGPEVVEVVVLPATHEQGVVARHRDVVEEHVGVGPAPDRHPVAAERERLADPSTAGADDERGAVVLDDVLDVHGDELARLVDPVGRRLRLAA